MRRCTIANIEDMMEEVEQLGPEKRRLFWALNIVVDELRLKPDKAISKTVAIYQDRRKEKPRKGD